jgi:hypothetical protein
MMENYLDLSPMIRALRESPTEFEMEGNFVRHRPSRHVLKFDVHGNAQLVARCNCSQLPIRQQQSNELRAAVAVWMDVYWRPLMTRQAAKRRVVEINQAFAEYFRPRGKFRRAFEAVLSFLGLDHSGSFCRADPSLPEDDELRARPTAATQEPKPRELLSA